MTGRGLLDPSLNWTCGFSPDGPLECLDVATWHGFRLTDDGSGIESMMAACDDHAARMGADFLHPMDTPCCVPGSRFVWPENFCYFEWGELEAVGVGDVQIANAGTGRWVSGGVITG
jgi:hypothetical protein